MKIRNFIGGEFVDSNSGAARDNVEPATGRPYSSVSESDATDVDAAVAAAGKAFSDWSATTAAARSAFLLDLARAIDERHEEFARAESIDTGKPIALARTVDIPRAVANLRFFATAILHHESELQEMGDRGFNYTLRSPLGVVATISPWNLPLYLLTWKVAPALATGNTVVAKPSELTPMTAYLLADVAATSGLPPGVLNIVQGTGPSAGVPLTTHAAVKAVSFTGGTATGAAIAQATADSFKKLALEMGGKNPNIVFADADLDAALPTSVRASFSNQGQICLCGSRLLVQQSIYDEFVERFVALTDDITVGDPLQEGTEFGAIVSEAQLEKVERYVNLARSDGGEILTGGNRPGPINDRCKGGYFFSPTIIAGLDSRCAVNQEEIFGPVVSIMPFDSEQDALALANSTDYGLAASLWTADLNRAHRVAAKLESGIVWVNCWMLRDLRVPFGGVKQSGVGREGGREALDFFTEPKSICVSLEGGKA